MLKMKTKLLAAGAALVATAGFAAAPAQAQYHSSQYGYGNNGVGDILGAIIRGVIGAGNYGQYPYGNYGYNNRYDRYGHGYGLNTRALVDRCAAAVENRLNRYAARYDRRYDRYNRRYDRYDRYNRYGNYNYGGQYGQARVAGITDIDRTRYGLSVDGVAMSGRYATQYNRYDRRGYGYGQRPDIKFDCDIERNGRIRDLDIDRR